MRTFWLASSSLGRHPLDKTAWSPTREDRIAGNAHACVKRRPDQHFHPRMLAIAFVLGSKLPKDGAHNNAKVAMYCESAHNEAWPKTENP